MGVVTADFGNVEVPMMNTFCLRSQSVRCFRFLRASCALTIIAAAWLVGANPAHAQSRAYISNVSPAVVEEGQTAVITVQFDGTPRTDDSLVTIRFAGSAAAPFRNTPVTPEYYMGYGEGASYADSGSSRLLDTQNRVRFRAPANDNSVTVHLEIRDDNDYETTQTIAFALIAHTGPDGDTAGRSVERLRQSVEIAANKGRSEVYITRAGIEAPGIRYPLTEEGVSLMTTNPDSGEFTFRLNFRGEQRTTDSIVLLQLGGDAVAGEDHSADFTWAVGINVQSGTLTSDNMARIRVPDVLPDPDYVTVSFPIPPDGAAESTKTITFRIAGHTNLDGSTEGTDEYTQAFEEELKSEDILPSEMNTYVRLVNPPVSVREGSSATVTFEFVGTPRPGTETYVSLRLGGIDDSDISVSYDDTARQRTALSNGQLQFLNNGTSRANIIITAAADTDNDYENIDIRIINYGISEGGFGSTTNTGHHFNPDVVTIIPIVPDHFSTTSSKVEFEGARTRIVREGTGFSLRLRFTGAARPNHSLVRWQASGSAVQGPRPPYDYNINPPINLGIDPRIRTNSAVLGPHTYTLSFAGSRVHADDFAESTETFTVALTSHTDLSGGSAGRIVDATPITFIIPPSSAVLHFPQDDTRIAFGVGTRHLYAVLSGPVRIRERDIDRPIGNQFIDVPDSEPLLATACDDALFTRLLQPGQAGIPANQTGSCGGFRIAIGGPGGPAIPISSVRVESIGGEMPAAASTGVVVIELMRPVRTGEETLWLNYNHRLARSRWNGRRRSPMPETEGYIFTRDTVAPAQLGLIGGHDRIFDVQMLHDPLKDSDGDGIADAAEAARFGTGPHVDGSGSLRPQVTLARGTTATAFVASGRLDDSESERLSHLGVTVTGASTVRAYYLSDTFGYEGGYLITESYGCSGRFPANYEDPLIIGGCAPVDFQNIIPGVEHRIGWFALNDRGWATADTNSRLPEQRIRRIPRVNMALERDFVRREATEILVRAVAETPVPLAGGGTVPQQGDNLSVLLPGGGEMRLAIAADRRSYASTLSRTPGNQAVEHYRINPDANRAYGDDDTGVPDSASYEIGLVNETAVYFIEGVAPSLGRPVLTKDGESEERTLVEEGGMNYRVTIPALYAGGVAAESEHLTNIRGVGLADEAGERVVTAFFDVPAGFAATTGTSVSLTITATAIARGDYASTQTATVTLSWPVVPMLAAGGSRMAADLMGDRDGDSIPDVQDTYPEIPGLPVMVSSGTEMIVNPGDHIRPVSPVHELSAGDRTRARASSETLAEEEDFNDANAGVADTSDYDKYSASEAGVRLSGNDPTPFEVTYDFDISGVSPAVDTSTTAEATTAVVTGGRAGVIIPLPETLSGTTSLFLYKYRGGDSTQTEAFTADTEPGGNEYGFAPADENGVCPTDDGTAASPYRDDDSGNLVRTKAAGDLCVVLYIVDGGPNDEDGEMNGIIKDPVGTSRVARTDVVMADATPPDPGGGGVTGGGAGGVDNAVRALGGGSGSFGLAGLGVLMLLALLVLLTPQTRRAGRRTPQ